MLVKETVIVSADVCVDGVTDDAGAAVAPAHKTTVPDVVGDKTKKKPKL